MTNSEVNESHDLQLLTEISQLLTVLDLDRVLQTVIDLAAKSVGAAKTSLFLHDGQDIDWEHIVVSRDLDSDQSVHVVRSVLDKGLAGWVAREGEGTIITDTLTDERWYVFPDDTYPVRSVLCVPFTHDGRVLAILTLVHPNPNHFTPHHLVVLTIIANQAAVAIHNALLFYQVQTQQQQLEAMLQAIPDGLLILSQNGDILLTNATAQGFLNRSQHDLKSKSLNEFAGLDKVINPIWEIVDQPIEGKAGEHWSFEVRSERLKRDYLITMSVWEKPAQIVSMAGYVVIMHDITNLRDLSRFKDEMMSIASHDLRSPLALITGYCDLIEMDATEGSPLKEYVDVIRRSTNRMNNLLNDLLRVEQIRSSPLELREDVALGDVIVNILENLRLMAGRKNQQIDVDADVHALPSVLADPVLIREAMENFVTNAIKYTPEGGHIIIHAYTDEGRFHYIVQDNGIGIPEGQVHRVFESFYRAKQPGTEKIEGTGLGLNLVKTVIERHSGEVWVESEQGVGSRFGFWLPLVS